MSEQHFPGGRVNEKRLRRACVSARMELEAIENRYREIGWDHAVGSSGSVRAVLDAVREMDPGAAAITADGLDALIDRVVQAGNVRNAAFGSISPDRALVFAGGMAILKQVFDSLGLVEMRVAEGALREGLLYDMLGRFDGGDVRSRTARSMEGRFHVDVAQADRVEATAVALLQQVVRQWDLEDPENEQFLRWAARLHEIGLDISHSHFHRHGAYLLEYADMPGFTREQQRTLACLVGSHRRKPHFERVPELVPPWDERAERLAVLLRLAVLFNRSRSTAPPPPVKLTVKGRTLQVKLKRGWLKANPLTAADLEQERAYLASVRYTLQFG